MSTLVGRQAPVFELDAIVDGVESKLNLADYIGKQEVVIFFYPKDFTFVCPTELYAFQEKLSDFEERGVKVIGVSTDTAETHWAWLNTPKNKGGIEGVKYPLIADVAKTMSMGYGVLGGDYYYDDDDELQFEGDAIAYRGTFFIDKEGIVRHEVVNFFPLGRNIDDTLRIVDAWHHVEEFGEVCPANWTKGSEAMAATHEGTAEYLSKH